MLIIYVKHYLTADGINYFNKQWFPKVKSMISQQKGFISITHDMDQDKDDYVHVTVKFMDETTVNTWAERPEHDNLVNELDNYRSRTYWEAARANNDESTDSLKLEWERIPAAT